MERKRLPKITSPRNDNGFPNYQSYELEKSLKTLLKCFQIYNSNPVEIRRKYFIQSFSMGINTMNALAVNASSMLIIAFNTRIVSRKLEPQGVDNFCQNIIERIYHLPKRQGFYFTYFTTDLLQFVNIQIPLPFTSNLFMLIIDENFISTFQFQLYRQITFRAPK